MKILKISVLCFLLTMALVSCVPKATLFVEPVEEQKEPETEVEEVQEGAEVEEQQSAGPANDAKKQKTLMWILVAAIVVLLIALFIALFKEQFAQMIRNLLYTEEELEIIRQWGAR
jgi:capsular polysaccharide biosynthesis protein